MNSPFSIAFRHGAGRSKTAIRRRPRTFLAASLLLMILGLVGSGGLAAVSTSPPATAAQFAFTVRAG